MTTTQERLEQLRDLSHQPVAGIMDNAVCVKVKLRKPGTHRKVEHQVQVVVEAPTDQAVLPTMTPAPEGMAAVPLINPQVKTDLTKVGASKKIMDAPEIDAINKLDGRIKKFLHSRALPSIFEEGVWLIPLSSVPEIDVILTNYVASRETLVQAAYEALGRIKDDDREALGDLYDESNYLIGEEFLEAFSMEFRYVSYGVSEKLAGISSEVYHRELSKTQEKFSNARDEIGAFLAEAMSELINHAVEKLTPDPETGKAKMMAKGRFEAMTEFLDTFGTRNIGNYTELAELVKRAKDVMSGVNREDMAKNEGLRDAILAGFTEVKTQLDGMIVDRPSRVMRFETEDEGV